MEDILLINADLLTNIDLEDFYLHFIEHKAEVSVASIPYRVNIPYAVLETENALVKGIVEKPNYTFMSNAGIYLLKAHLVKEFIKSNQFYNATDLLEALIERNRKVTTYAHLQYWLDIGKPDDYVKAQEEVKHISFK